MFNTDLLQNYLDTATEAAMAGGEVLQECWGKLTEIKEKKYPGELVTEADRKSEERIIAILKERFPSHPILAEETGFQSAEMDEFLWAIDPLDGTTNYTHQFPFVAVSIALLYRRQPMVGVVYNPILNELFRGSKGLGVLLNHHEVSVSSTDDLKKGLLATGFAYDRRETPDNNFAEFCHLINLSQGVRRSGAASLDLAYVAAGRFDGYWERGLKPWDMAAGAVLVEEAGGRVSAYDGDPLDLFSGKILATNGHLHQKMSDELRTVALTNSVKE